MGGFACFNEGVFSTQDSVRDKCQTNSCDGNEEEEEEGL